VKGQPNNPLERALLRLAERLERRQEEPQALRLVGDNADETPRGDAGAMRPPATIGAQLHQAFRQLRERAEAIERAQGHTLRLADYDDEEGGAA
jgi:hypothetical protein